MPLRLFVIISITGLSLGGCAHGLGDGGKGIETAKTEKPAPKLGAKASLGGKATKVLSWRQSLARRVDLREDELVPAHHVARPPHAVADTDGPYLLDSGDKLRVFVYDQPDLSRIYTVDHAGKISVPLIGLVRARKKTVYAVAGAIRARLAARFVRDPHVTVDIHENRPFFILGEVRAPGKYPYVNGMTVETAVAIAGGYTARANETRFRVTRRINGVVEVNDARPEFVVRPGDTIKVVERFF